MSTILSIWTVVVFILFIAIFLWVWSGKNKRRFDADAQIPFNEDDDPVVQNKELDNG